MMTTEKSLETRLRRMADRQGLRLVKSKRRDPNAIGYGMYMLVDPWNSNAVIGPEGVGPTGEPNWTLDEVEAYLTRPASYWIEFPDIDLDDIGGAASPSDLGLLLAHALVSFDRQGTPRPRYTMSVIEEGRERKARKAEEMELAEALESRRHFAKVGGAD